MNDWRLHDIRIMEDCKIQLSYSECICCPFFQLCFWNSTREPDLAGYLPYDYHTEDAYDEPDLDDERAEYRDAWYDYENYHQTYGFDDSW